MLVAVDIGVSGGIAIEHDDGRIELKTPAIYTETKRSEGKRLKQAKELEIAIAAAVKSGDTKLYKKLVTSYELRIKSSKNFYDLKKLPKCVPEGKGHFILENVSRMPHDSAHNASLLMEGKGFYRGIAACRGLQETLVMPAVWKKALGLATGATKKDSIELARKLYPDLAPQLTTKQYSKNLDGVAEALLLLYYLKNFIINPPEKPVKTKKKKNG